MAMKPLNLIFLLCAVTVLFVSACKVEPVDYKGFKTGSITGITPGEYYFKGTIVHRKHFLNNTKLQL